MLYSGDPPKAFDVLREAPTEVVTASKIEPDHFVEKGPSIPRRMVRAVAGVAITSYLLLGGAGPAKAASSESIVAQVQSPESVIDWGTIFVGITATAALVAVLRQSKDKLAERFFEALQSIKGESTGEERLARLNVIAYFANRLGYASEVLEASAVYLRARRGGIIKLKKEHEGKPKDFDDAITERRNADRTAFKLLLRTLRVVRRQMNRQDRVRRNAKRVNISYKEGDEPELRRIDELTDLQVDPKNYPVNARGICLDYMRGEVCSCSLRDVDLTGAGLQYNDMVRVSFSGACLREAQLEGSRLSNCSLEGTDLRAAYFGKEGHTIIEKCLIDANTKFGNLPKKHLNAKYGMLEPGRANEYRGIPNVILRDLISDTLTPEQIVELVKEWQRNGLTLLPGSNPEYFLNPDES